MPGPDLTPDEVAEARRQKAAKRTPEQQAVMDAYVAGQTNRPATTMSHDEQVAEFSRRFQASRSKRIGALAKARAAKEAADRAAAGDGAPVEQTPAGTHFKQKALAEASDLGQAGQTVRGGAQKVLDVTDTTTAKVLGVGAKVATGGDVRGIVQNAAVLGDLSGQAMIANDAKIKQGFDSSVERNEASSADLAGKVTDFQSATKGSAERKAAALKTFQSAGTRARDQAELGAYQDLTMRVGPEEYSKDEVLGKAAPDVMDYEEGDVVKREDAMHGSTYGKFKRAVQTGGFSTAGKLSDEQKADIGSIQQELDDEKTARTAEHAGRDAGSLKGQAKRFILHQGSKLTDDEKDEIERISAAKSTHETNAKATEAQLRESKEQIRKQVEALKSQQPTRFMTDARKAKHADLQRQIDALQPSLDEGRKKLADHRAATKSALEEFDGQVGDIHARANGGFTRAETAARAAKEQKITDIRTGATAAENFTDEHAGKTINHYNRVGGMIDRMEDPAKMEATTSGTIAHYANKFGEHTEDFGNIVSGSADAARDLQEKGKYAKSTATAAVGIGMEAAKIAGAPVGAGLAGDGLQKVISSGMTGVGKGVQALTADAAAEERERTHSRDVVSGKRREDLKTSSFVTTRRPDKSTPTIAGALADVGKAFLGADAVKDGIMDGIGLGEKEEDGGSSGGGDERPAAPEDKASPLVGDEPAVGGDEHVGAPDLGGDEHVGAPDLSGEPHEVGHSAGVGGNQEVGGGHVGGGDIDGGGEAHEEVVHDEVAHDEVAPGPHGDASQNAMVAAPNDGPVPEVEDEHAGGGGPVVEDEHAGGGDEHDGGGGPVVEDEHAGGGDEHDGGEEEGAGKEEDGAHDPRAEEEKPFGEKVVENAQGEGYEMGGDQLLDKGADKFNAFVAAPEVKPKADARVLHPQVPGPGPGPGPAPGPKQHVPWWKRLWRAVKRGARAVGRGVMRAGRAVGRGAMRAGRAVKRGFSNMGRRIRSWFS
jgi:hypothetical protein